ncbi:hypothetical protein [Alicyclobacillus vulcanalis]|uniref:Uncharacterized protein n=1 Tax=Alicyclobacillus vulcanalis TaxID=252246 RepID=A0A1N7NNZ1_9BACL|nr:hypothetical protein [Alicyclobacillus vulcanalis]SIT00027.1 hypothetical protein SAMN05421799_10963 [Alicyclobacillus vulcanalis]
MRWLRLAFRVFRFVSTLYALWNASRFTRALYVGRLLWRAIRRKPIFDRPPRVVIEYVGAKSPHLYRRRGWRRIRPAHRVDP